MAVKTQHPQYIKYSDQWKRCRDASAGQDAVHAEGPRYLPKLKDQTEDEYKAYVSRAGFYNATWRTIVGLRGMLFRLPPRIEVPPATEELLEDVTLDGTPFPLLLSETVEEALTVGRLGILVDYPAVKLEGLTQADAKLLNLRPTMGVYKAESIINWQHRVIGNKSMLSQVRLQECKEELVTEFEVKETKTIRVLDLDPNNEYRQRTFIIKEDGTEVPYGDEVYPLMNNQKLKYIPFYFVGVDDVTWEVDAPPLIDLVDLNMSHYRSNADYEHGCHFTGLPTPVVSGYSPADPAEKLYIGSMSAWVFTDPAAKASFLEFTGEGLGALERNLEKKELRMAVLGARMLEPQKKGVETSDTAMLHRNGENSMLADMAQSLSLALERALQTFSDWAGSQGEVECELNKNFFPTPMTPQQLTALVGAWQAGGISKETLFDNLQEGEVIAKDRSFEDEEAAIADEAPKLAPTMLPGTPGAAVPEEQGTPGAPPQAGPKQQTPPPRS